MLGGPCPGYAPPPNRMIYTIRSGWIDIIIYRTHVEFYNNLCKVFCQVCPVYGRGGNPLLIRCKYLRSSFRRKY